LNNPDLGNKLGNNAREVSMKRHDSSQIAGRMLEIYQNVIEDFKKCPLFH